MKHEISLPFTCLLLFVNSLRFFSKDPSSYFQKTTNSKLSNLSKPTGPRNPKNRPNDWPTKGDELPIYEPGLPEVVKARTEVHEDLQDFLAMNSGGNGCKK